MNFIDHVAAVLISNSLRTFRLTILTHRRLRHSPILSLPLPSSQSLDLPLRIGFISYVSCSPARSPTHLSPSISISTPCTILSSTHSRLAISSTHFLSPHSQPRGGATSSKNRVPFGLSPEIRCGDSGSYGVGLNIQLSHSPLWPPLRRCNSKTSTSRCSGGASRTTSWEIQASSHDCAVRSWGARCSS